MPIVEVALVRGVDLADAYFVFPRHREASYLEELNRDGGGSFKILASDPELVANPHIIDENLLVRVKVDNTISGYFVIRSREVEVISEGELAGQWITVAGPGLKPYYDDTIVIPELYRNASSRPFSFASSQFLPAGQSWPAAAFCGGTSDASRPYGSPTSSRWTSMVGDWPSGAPGYWIWDRPNDYGNTAPVGWCYFRKTFTITRRMTVRVTMTSDDYGVVYLDGQVVVDNPVFYGWQKIHTADVVLESGTHQFAAKVNNNGAVIAGLIVNICELSPGSTSIDYSKTVFATDNTVQCLGYPAAEPGYTPGKILTEINSEAGYRNARTFSAMFDETTTSQYQGWPSQYALSVKAGASVPEVLDLLADGGYADHWFDDRGRLCLAPDRGSDQTQYVTFQEGYNAVRAQVSATMKIVNTLYVRKDAGIRRYDGPALSVAAYGIREGYLSLTDKNDAETQAEVDAYFQKNAFAQYSPTLDIFPQGGDTPWVNFGVGDWVMAPGDLPGQPVRQRRVMSIAVKELDNGGVQYSTEIDTISQDAEERTNRRLTRLANTLEASGTNELTYYDRPGS